MPHAKACFETVKIIWMILSDTRKIGQLTPLKPDKLGLLSFYLLVSPAFHLVFIVRGQLKKPRCPGMTVHSSRRLLPPDKVTTGSGTWGKDWAIYIMISSCPYVESNCSLTKLCLSGVSLVNTQECGVWGKVYFTIYELLKLEQVWMLSSWKSQELVVEELINK